MPSERERTVAFHMTADEARAVWHVLGMGVDLMDAVNEIPQTSPLFGKRDELVALARRLDHEINCAPASAVPAGRRDDDESLRHARALFEYTTKVDDVPWAHLTVEQVALVFDMLSTAGEETAPIGTKRALAFTAEKCPECGGDGAHHDDSHPGAASYECDTCGTTGYVPKAPAVPAGDDEDARLRDGLAAAHSWLAAGDRVNALAVLEAVLAGGDVPELEPTVREASAGGDGLGAWRCSEHGWRLRDGDDACMWCDKPPTWEPLVPIARLAELLTSERAIDAWLEACRLLPRDTTQQPRDVLRVRFHALASRLSSTQRGGADSWPGEPDDPFMTRPAAPAQRGGADADS